MEKFDYSKAVEELEKLAEKVEDPSTALSDIDVCLKRSSELISSCRDYLRAAREKTEEL